MILISGATGFLGTHLLKTFCRQNVSAIRALYRSEEKKAYTLNFLKTLLPQNKLDSIENIDWVKADIVDIPELEKAFKNVKQVYHVAAWVATLQKIMPSCEKSILKGRPIWLIWP